MSGISFDQSNILGRFILSWPDKFCIRVAPLFVAQQKSRLQAAVLNFL